MLAWTWRLVLSDQNTHTVRLDMVHTQQINNVNVLRVYIMMHAHRAHHRILIDQRHVVIMTFKITHGHNLLTKIVS